MRTKQFLLCLLALLGSITAHAYDLDMNGVYYNITDADAKNVEVTYVENGEGNADFYYGSVTIPRRFSKDGVTYNVTAIGANAFTQCTSLTAVTIPTSVTSIGGGAFYGCSSLTSIAIPSSVTSIGNEAFKGCTSLTAVNISDLEAWCKIDFANGSCQNPLTYAHRLYLNGNELTELVVPEGITDLKITFDHCHSLTSVSLPSSVKTISDYAFNDCVNITSVNIPESVTAIYNCAFRNCQRLLSVSLPSSMTFIDSYTFQDCWDLKNVVIPANTTQIGKYAFSNCYSLKSMVVSSSTPPVFGETTLNDACTIFVPNNSVETYKAAEGWSTFADRIQPQTGWTFTAAVPCGEGTADLTFKVTSANPWEVEVSASPEDIAGALTIPATVQHERGIEFAVKAICGDAFLRRHSLTSVVLPEGLTCILDRAFNECENLERVILPSSLKDIYQGAFMNCTSLSSITLPDGLTKISLATFQNTPSLKSINLPEGINTIEHDAFRGSGLESIKFPSTLTSVGHEAFRDCKSLTSIDFNRCSANFEYESFYACSSLEELYIPNTVKFRNNDGSWAWGNFQLCSALKSVIFEAFEEGQQRWSTTTVFADCYALETVVLPSTSVMQNGFFAGCDNLRSVTFLEISDDFTPRTYNFYKMFQLLDPNKIHFTVPESHAEELVKAGYINISDLSALPMARTEFEAQASRITTMMNALSDGDKTTLTAAISSARSAANTAEDYATVYAQITAIKTAAKTYLSTATLPDGFDVTAAYVINPDFDQLQLGWDFNQNWAVYPNVNQRGWNEAAYGNGDVSIDKFIDTWEQTTLHDGQITQTISALPAGIYRLEADIIATNQNNAETAVTGVSLFAGSQSIAVATENQKPQHFSVKFENTLTKDVTIGININGTNANWVAMDNVRLIYEGKAADIPQGIDLASDENARVYLYNVETGKYLSAGHSWGNHAMLDETGLPVRLTQNAETGLWQVYFWEGSKCDQLLFSNYSNYINPEEEVCVNYNHEYSYADENLTLWRITQTGDGSYLIQNKKYLDTEFYLGNIPTRQDYQYEYSGISYTDIISKASVNDNSHWLIFTKENSDQLSAKHRLMAAILRMEASDNVNDELLAAAQTVYNNADATAVEVIDITTQLNSQMGMPAENQPVDMTALIINPRFENNTTEGWSGANAVGGRADATSNHEQEFFEKDFNMYQTITGVPNGIYRLKWKGLHRPGSCDQVYNEFNAGTNNASAVVYANNTQKTMLNWATGAGDADLGDWQANGVSYPNSMEVARRYFDAGLYADFLEVEVTDNVLTIGVKNTEPMTGEHWVVFSDFELYIMENAEQAHNKLVASSAKGLSGGKATLPINMTNQDAIAGIQFKVKLPEGMTLNTNANGTLKVSKTTRTNALNTLSASDRGDYYQVLAYGIDQSVAPGTGAIAKLELNIAEELGLGEYEVEIYDVVLSNMAGLRIRPFSTQSIVTLVDAEVGDANHDGEVDVADIIAIANHILGTTPDTFDETAANVNGDEDIDVADIIGVANIILNGKPSSVKARYAERRETDYLDPQ